MISLSFCSLCRLSISAFCFAAAPAAVFCSCARCWSNILLSSAFFALICSIIFHFLKLGSNVLPVVLSLAPADVGAPPVTGAGWCLSSIMRSKRSSSAAWASSAASSAVVRFLVLGFGGGALCAGCRKALSIL